MSTISITLPAELADIAAKIGRAFDPDIGGDKSFGLSADGLTISTSAPCTDQFYAWCMYVLGHPDTPVTEDGVLAGLFEQHPEELYAACAADYAERWQGFEAPTLEECTAFCAGVIREPQPELSP
jgi:hypothetical protein